MHPVERFITELRERVAVAAARAEADMLAKQGARPTDIIGPVIIEVPAPRPLYS